MEAKVLKGLLPWFAHKRRTWPIGVVISQAAKTSRRPIHKEPSMALGCRYVGRKTRRRSQTRGPLQVQVLVQFPGRRGELSIPAFVPMQLTCVPCGRRMARILLRCIGAMGPLYTSATRPGRRPRITRIRYRERRNCKPNSRQASDTAYLVHGNTCILCSQSYYLYLLNRGRQFIVDHLRMEDVTCYWQSLLTQYTKLLKYTVKKKKDFLNIRKWRALGFDPGATCGLLYSVVCSLSADKIKRNIPWK